MLELSQKHKNCSRAQMKSWSLMSTHTPTTRRAKAQRLKADAHEVAVLSHASSALRRNRQPCKQHDMRSQSATTVGALPRISYRTQNCQSFESHGLQNNKLLWRATLASAGGRNSRLFLSFQKYPISTSKNGWQSQATPRSP